MTVQDFFKALYRNTTGYAEIRMLHKSGDWKLVKKLYREASTIYTCNFDTLAQLNTDYHIYHRVNVSKTTNSKKENITQVVALYVDVDDNSQESLDRLKGMFYPPNCIIASGGGYHGYWMLREPLTVAGDDAIFEVERTMQGMILSYGEHADEKAKDITRILRTPGYLNIKDKYPTPPRCEIVHFDADVIRYGYKELHREYAPLGTPKPMSVKRTIPTEALTKQLPNRVKTYLNNGASVGNRNHELFYCARAYNDAGYSEHDALADLGTVARSDGLRDDEISQTIRSAFAYTPDRSYQIPQHMRMVMSVEDGVQ